MVIHRSKAVKRGTGCGKFDGAIIEKHPKIMYHGSKINAQRGETVYCKIRSLGLHGVTGYEVTAECDLSGGLPNFTVVGLPEERILRSEK